MQVSWQVSEVDIRYIREFFEKNKDNNSMVKTRISKNINREDMAFSREEFWKNLVSCLLTTQQRSGPNSAIARFLNQNPYPLSYENCKEVTDVEAFVKDHLKESGGIRRSNTIAKEAKTNLAWLENSGWKVIENIWTLLKAEDTPEAERETSSVIIKNLKGFGPKQARNLLQQMGVTKYEIPIDSRIMKWMKAFGFPLELSAKGLADDKYYNFILDGFQEMCKAANIYPCLMDAVIFTSFDAKGDWAEKASA